MNFIANESPQKLRGGFYTDPEVAGFLADWVLQGHPTSLLEPSCGDGAFLEAIVGQKCPSLQKIVACELDPAEAAKAGQRVHGRTPAGFELREGDFLRWFLFQGREGSVFDAVVGNPPFIRYQYLPEEQQWLAEKLITGFGLPFTKHTNAWVPFVIASVALLTPRGRLAMVVPSELLHIPHAQSLRTFLTAQCDRILILDPQELWFGKALQGVVLLLAEKKSSVTQVGQGIAVQAVAGRESLRHPAGSYFQAADFAQPEPKNGKWMRLFLTGRERSVLRALEADGHFARFVQLAEVDVGIVTGANDFFLVPDDVVEEFGLAPWAHPMFGRSEHVRGLIYHDADHATNRAAGLPANFLWFDAAEASTFPPAVQRYLQFGEEQGLPKRYKCQVRQPWFRVPSVSTAPAAMLKRAHQFPRLILNRAGAFTTDTAYRIRINQGTATSLVYSFLNSLTCLGAELEGRHYGGGVLELVPSEIERLVLPVFAASESALEQLDEQFRTSPQAEQILRHQDRIVLANAGVSAADQDLIHGAWDRLRNRRQRTDAQAPASPEIP